MNKATARALKLILEGPDNRLRPSLSSFLAQQIRRPFKKPIQREREAKDKAKKLSKKEETARIREACLGRAGTCCEVWFCGGAPEEMDHWLGGSGRRRQKQSVETCWMLCRAHHLSKTRSYPSAEYWNDLFEKHCQRYSYPFVPHIEHQEVSRG